jgi:hypothetical protein
MPTAIGIRRVRCVASLARVLALTLAGAMAAGAATAQHGATDPLAALQNGQLVVWVVEPAAATPMSKTLAIAALHNATPLTYQEHDAGTFGQSAGSYGTASSNVGVASSSSTISAAPAGTGYHEQESGGFGQPSGSTGTAAGSYGQTASTLGQTAGSYGVDASNHGHDAGTYGNSLSTIAQAANPAAQSARNLSPHEADDLRNFKQQVSSAFPNLRVVYLSADPAELQTQLAAAQHTAQAPDLLISPASGSWWSGIQHEFGLATLRPASFRADGVTQTEPFVPQLAVVAHAPHMQTARAFAIWMSETSSECDGCVLGNFSPDARAAAGVAVDAVTRLLHGESLGGEADPEMAEFPPRSALAVLGGMNSQQSPLRIDVMRASTDGRVAAVTLRAIESTSSAFGVAHSLVVLRRDQEGQQDGRWRVLHVSLDLPPAEQQGERETLMNSIAAAPGLVPAGQSEPKGISQASPTNGDTRPPEPVLWWDNGGGASLQVIEWQTEDGGHWSDARLYLAPDVGARLRTQVTALFATSPTTYRWRVWSVGAKGEMKISPWSTLKIVG